MSRSRKVLLGVTGSIAAFKSAELIRLLRAGGWEVRCAATRGATAFVTPLTLEVLSGNPVYQEEYMSGRGSGEELHITAAQWPDLLCVAPATAHTLAKLAHGLADDFLTTTALAFEGPVVVAPAMSHEMWENAAVRRNVELLVERGVLLLGPTVGPLASGATGIGRLVEPEEIVAALERALEPGLLAGRKVLVTAGPTREPADPVRFLSNRSSGKMGFAIAAEAAAQGARTVLVAGPVDRATPPSVERVDVVTALEMRDAVYREAADADLVVMAAAVCDFRPQSAADRKLKKSQGWERLELTPNPDILSGLREVAPAAVIVGFAAETDDLESEARRKLADKGTDFIVANDVSREDTGFESEQNEVTVFSRLGEPLFLERQSKRLLAAKLVSQFAQALERVETEAPAIDR
ncbi:MAG: bifunctional phosphopantothenoylcysteine decarboxylase/phosphopantothenate--cysteine ligase CoaBC [Thermoanaerobaculia bacterium]|nr:bifunctional phosphopantothenoylcysteine decarboxylase/phosphopantothenate--cysteine ligase CoaBC [Thermoanaerobaculia bacterium]